MVPDMALTAECGKAFIEGLQQTYCFTWNRILTRGSEYRFEIGKYLFVFKVVENVVTMDMYLNMNDPVPVQYQPKLARVSKDLGTHWYMNDDLPKDRVVFVDKCVSRFIQVHERLTGSVSSLQILPK